MPLSMLRSPISTCAAFALAVSAIMIVPAASGQATQRALVSSAALHSWTFRGAWNRISWHRVFPRGRPVMIARETPRQVSMVGGPGGGAGGGARDPKGGNWVGPAFYTLATASVGIQAG